MSNKTNIQWCHSTVNPCMGCKGCELYPAPKTVASRINTDLLASGIQTDSYALMKELIDTHHRMLPIPGPGHVNDVTVTNIWHFREEFRKEVARRHGGRAGRTALTALKSEIKCYAGKLHFNRASNILKPERGLNKGYAPVFEQVTNFDGRVTAAAKWQDTLGTTPPDKPWLDGLPRLTFVSDMGDALCLADKARFAFLEREVIAPATSPKGLRHLWLWLTKQPRNMRAFADRIGGMPGNFCAMTTVTSSKTLGRVEQLRKVKASCRGLSIEPLWDRIPPAKLDLSGIDWVIIGGESGSREVAEPFHVEWALELKEHCRKAGVAFFVKQLGRHPYMNGQPLRLADPHGGDWNEWPKALRVREFPAYFHRYRAVGVKAAKTRRVA
jgi:protein gp37